MASTTFYARSSSQIDSLLLLHQHARWWKEGGKEETKKRRKEERKKRRKGQIIRLTPAAAIARRVLKNTRRELRGRDEVPHDVLRGLRLSRSRFSGDDDGLILITDFAMGVLLPGVLHVSNRDV